MYRDAANYKEHHSVVFAGEITDEEREVLGVETLFIPGQIDLPNLREEMDGDYDDDTDWHEVFRVELTNERASINRGDIHAFVAMFRNTHWDDGSVDVKAIERAAFESGDVQDALDELVHDALSKQASDINNGGIVRQVGYLLAQGLTRSQIHEALSIAPDDRDAPRG